MFKTYFKIFKTANCFKTFRFKHNQNIIDTLNPLQEPQGKWEPKKEGQTIIVLYKRPNGRFALAF